MYGRLWCSCQRRPKTHVENYADAMGAIAAEWVCLRAQDVWDEAHPQTLGSVQSEAKRNNKTIHIGPFSISALKNIANSMVVCANTKGA